MENEILWQMRAVKSSDMFLVLWVKLLSPKRSIQVLIPKSSERDLI